MKQIHRWSSLRVSIYFKIPMIKCVREARERWATRGNSSIDINIKRVPAVEEI